MDYQSPSDVFASILYCSAPAAAAKIHGSAAYPDLNGQVSFYATPYDGVLVSAEIYGLPDSQAPIASGFFGMHIHENGICASSFDTAGGHDNPYNLPHPYHAGDLLPLLSNRGYAMTSFYSARFSIDDILGKSVIIHRMPDDFASQPAGASGERIGCGIIKADTI